MNAFDTTHLRRESDVLDIGCGAGNMMHHLARYGRVKGVDVDARPVAMAQARGYDVRQGDAARVLPFPSAAFDDLCRAQHADKAQRFWTTRE